LCAHKSHPGERTPIKEAPVLSVIALSLTASGCIALFFFPQPLYRLMANLFAI
jgi:multicomponent Na+:H+ antiporter subunit D